MMKPLTVAPTTAAQTSATPEQEERHPQGSHGEAGGGPRLTGLEHLQQLEASGFVGLWKDRTDIGDSSEFARRLRESIESRADRYDEEEPAV